MASIVYNRLMAFIAFLAAGFVLLIILAWTLQERIAFQPPHPPFPDPASTTRVDYTAADGQHLFAYVIGHPDKSTPLVIAFHGNADLSVRMIDWAYEILERTGIPVMLAEYRGYMGIAGRPTYAGVGMDAEAAYTYAHEKLGIPDTCIALFGHSLGSAVAAELAAKHPARALILESPFTSARDMAAAMVGSWFTSSMWSLVSRLHFNTVSIVESLNVPVSVAHGGRDRVVPSRMGEAVYQQARVKGKWLFIRDASHNDMRTRGGEHYWEWITGALESLMARK
jgi:fermentation-respiration switch protein FrsA (DUF1100 family)